MDSLIESLSHSTQQRMPMQQWCTKASMNDKELVPLLDLDGVVFRCGFSADAQIKKEFLEVEPMASEEQIKEALAGADYLSHALGNTKTVMEAVLARYNHENYKAFLHAGGNYRYSGATIKPYKGNRDRDHKPKYFNEIREYLFDVWKAIPVEGIESDDAIGIVQSTAPYGTTIIVTNDKDLRQIAGYHFNWTKPELGTEEVTPEEADMMFYWQMLVGDTSDNIPGINKIGPKTATKIIDECGGDLDKVKQSVIQYYAKQYGNEWQSAWNEIGTLLYIRRTEDGECPLL